MAFRGVAFSCKLFGLYNPPGWAVCAVPRSVSCMCPQLGGLSPSRISTTGCFVFERGFFGAARSPMPARSSRVFGLSGFPWAFSGMALHLGVQWSDQVSWAGLGADLDSEGEPFWSQLEMKVLMVATYSCFASHLRCMGGTLGQG